MYELKRRQPLRETGEEALSCEGLVSCIRALRILEDCDEWGVSWRYRQAHVWNVRMECTGSGNMRLRNTTIYIALEQQ